MAIITNPAFVKYHTAFPSRALGEMIQWSMDYRRAMIFFRRVKNIGEDPDIKVIGTFSPDTRDHTIITPYHAELENKRKAPIFGENSPNTSEHSKFKSVKGGSLSDYIAIIDLDAKGKDNQYEVIRLPFVPKELEYNSESSFVAIKPMGRNNPIYHYTGSEDQLEFEIDWYAFDWGRRQVIENCRKIEALSKADGYKGDPHRVKLMWGKENVLFSDHEFLVLSAPYRLSHFNRGNINSNGEIESTYMLPIQAYQRVTLGRITRNNLTKIEVEYVGNAAPTSKPPELANKRDYNLI